MSEAQIKWGFFNATQDCDIAIIEGVRGLYEGLTATEDVGSTAHIAKILKAPVVLVIDIRGITKSAAAYILGFKQLDAEINIVGVILNQYSTNQHAQKASIAVKKFANIPIIGIIPNKKEHELQQRHLGLIPMAEYQEKEEIISNIGQFVAENVDLEQIIAIANGVNEIKENTQPLWKTNENLSKQKIKVGIARDKAFNFYYQDNLDALLANGAKLIEFSPVKGETLPNADCYLLGGGFPEFFSKEIAQNKIFLEDLKNSVINNLPIYAECGGLMVLGKNLITRSGIKYPFADVFQSNIIMTTERQGLAYVEGITTKNHPFLPPNRLIKGHEFHYSKINDLKSANFGYKIRRGKGIDGTNDGLCINNSIASFLHIHTASIPDFAENFLNHALKSKE